MGVCTSKKLTNATQTRSIEVVMSIRTKVPRLGPVATSTLAKSRDRRRSSESTDPEVGSGLSSPNNEPTGVV